MCTTRAMKSEDTEALFLLRPLYFTAVLLLTLSQAVYIMGLVVG